MQNLAVSEFSTPHLEQRTRAPPEKKFVTQTRTASVPDGTRPEPKSDVLIIGPTSIDKQSG